MSFSPQSIAPTVLTESSSPQQSQNHCLAILLGVVLLIGTLAYFVPTFHTMTRLGSPYEAWDEIAGYNTSFVLAGEHTQRAHFYGTLDIAKFVLADALYTRVDPIGMTLRRVNYTNNVPETLEDHRVFYGPNYWRPQALGAIEYVYFRGVQDRTPIFWTRTISLGLCMAAYLTLGFLFLRYAPTAAPWLIGGLAVFVCQPSYQEQFTHALPNAFNALLITGAWFLSVTVLRAPSHTKMIMLGAILGIAVNSKFDAIVYTSGAGLAALAAPWIGRQFSVRPTVSLVASFTTVVLLTNPYLWFDPIQQFTIKRQFLSGVGVGSPSLSNNWDVFARFAQQVFSTGADNTTPIGAGVASLFFVTIALVGLLLPFALDQGTMRSRVAQFLVSGSFLAFALLVPLLLANTLYARYFLPALCLIVCQLGLAVAPLATRRPWQRIAAVVVLIVFAASFFGHARGLSHLAKWVNQGLRQNHGLDPTHSRNQAVLHVVKQLLQEDDRIEIVVDQHSYLDLREFLERGKQPVYINALNFERVLSEPEGKSNLAPRIVIYAPGTTAVQPDWKGRWKPEMEARYTAYIATLEKLPTLATFGQNPCALLEWAPPATNDLVKIARIR